MQAHPQRLLLPFYRRAIYKGIDKATGQKAHKIKVTLSILTAQYVIPYWRIPLFMIEEGEEDYAYWLVIPYHLVEMAKGVSNGTAESNRVLKEANHLTEVNAFTGQMDDSPYYHEWCAFEAALDCVWEALNRGHWKTLETDDSVTDTTTDEELECHADTAMLACLAYTGGSWTPVNPDKWTYDKAADRWITNNENWYFEDYGVWDRNTDRAMARRREFWEWWLSQAIVECWNQAQEF
jgi:hypothetical protein